VTVHRARHLDEHPDSDRGENVDGANIDDRRLATRHRMRRERELHVSDTDRVEFSAQGDVRQRVVRFDDHELSHDVLQTPAPGRRVSPRRSCHRWSPASSGRALDLRLDDDARSVTGQHDVDGVVDAGFVHEL
jgi:hypothetical protein